MVVINVLQCTNVDTDRIQSYLRCTVAGDTIQVFFSISCQFLNYINQLTVIICYRSGSILSFIDCSSLDIAKYVASDTFHKHYGFSREKKHLQSSIFWWFKITIQIDVNILQIFNQRILG